MFSFPPPGEQGSTWQYSRLQMEVSDDQFLVFEGEVGSSWKGDIALDQLSVQPGACQGSAQIVQNG